MNIRSIITFSAFPALFLGTAASAQISTSGALGAPAILGGSTVSGASAGHAGLAPTVSQAAPAAEPLSDGVTNATAAAGSGLTATGQNLQANGLAVGSGTPDGRPVASVGVNDSSKSGTVVGVLNPAHGQQAATVGGGTANQGAIASVLNP